jgi:hypothetical protein
MGEHMNRLKIIFGVLVLGSVLSACSWFGITWYMDTLGRVATLEAENGQLKAKPPLQTDGDIIARVSTLLVLPQGIPKVVPVADVETLKKTQLFFENAQNGDKLLVYPTKVILYSPFLDKIVEVAVVK